eukprot:TRINITY_DN6400_c0_g1_i1.p1 TRINITY_DN6400_c0_g1~~TRINITY_DN6400_c0_g1_i1.p1  ORF type:complete len:436 (+),score=52.53 TRINITY_DN6400_c0_g1_i1:313-1620(+)
MKGCTIQQEESSPRGRYITTKPDITFEPGDIVFNEDPVIAIPEADYACIACLTPGCKNRCAQFSQLFGEIQGVLKHVGPVSKRFKMEPGHVYFGIKYVAMLKVHVDDHKGFRLRELLALSHSRHEAQMEKDLAIAAMIMKVMPESHSDVISVEDLASFIGITFTHSLSIPFIRGAGLFYFSSLLEHSCCQNTSYQIEKKSLHLIAMEPIGCSEPVTISYLRPYLPKADRRTKLQEQYNFTCACLLCQPETFDKTRGFCCQKCTEGIVYPKNDGESIEDWVCNDCQEVISEDHFNIIKEAEQNIYEDHFADIEVDRHLEEKIFHFSHFYLFWAMDYRVMLISRVQPKLAKKYLELITESCDLVLPTYHPRKAVYWDMLGQVHILLRDLLSSQKSFQKAHAIRQICCNTLEITSLAETKALFPDQVPITLYNPTMKR